MSHIDTLQVYEDLIASGIPEKQAKAQIKSMDTFYSNIKDEFVSNKLISILGTLLLIVASATIGQLWNLSMKFERMDTDMKYVIQKLDNMEKK